MATEIVTLETSVIPAYLQKRTAPVVSDFAANVGSGGFPVLSIKGKVFTLVKKQERTVLCRPDDPEEAATFLEVVFLRANPNLSKIYYAAAYDEGATVGKPDCYSNDGTKPAADAATPQCKTCAACAHNVWGTGQNGKGFKCQSSRRVAIAAPDQLNEPMLLRIPPATLTPLADYAKALVNRGVDLPYVVTKIRFDREEATPKLTFQFVRFLSEEAAAEAQVQAKSTLVETIIGVGAGANTAPVEPAHEPAKALKAPVVDDAELDKALTPPKAKVAEKAATVAKKEKPAPAVEADDGAAQAKAAISKAKGAAVAQDLDALLAGLDDD